MAAGQMNIPNQPLSSDIIDRRNGQTPTLAEKVRDLMIKVHSDWQDSQNHGQGMAASPYGPNPNDADALRDQVHQVLGSGDGGPINPAAAQRIRTKVNSGR